MTFNQTKLAVAMLTVILVPAYQVNDITGK